MVCDSADSLSGLWLRGDHDGDTAPRAGYTYLVVWKLKDKASVKAIADGTAAVGFYDYFSQVNIGGEQVGPDELVAALLSL